MLAKKEAVHLDISKQEYNQLIQAHARPSPLVRDMLWAFFVGGAICTLGQVLRNLYQSLGLSGDDAGIAVSVTLIFLSALLTGLGIFDKLAKRAGVEMPITQAAYQVLYEGRDPKTVLQELMRREKRHEMEETWI